MHIRSVGFWEPIVALNQISHHHHWEVWVLGDRSVIITTEKCEFWEIPKWGKKYLLCYKCIEWLDNSKLNNFSANSIWRLILISSWWHSYYFIDIWRLIDTCPPPLCCSNDSQKCEWKIINTEQTERKNTKKKVQFEKPMLVSWIFLET